MGPKVGISVDYESPLAHGVARAVWSGLSVAALASGHDRATARWESLRAPRGSDGTDDVQIRVFVVGQDLPDAVDAVDPAGEAPILYGVIVAVPERPSPLAGSLLYQGVERLTRGGVGAGYVEPALLHALPGECGSYARRLLERLSALPGV